MSAYNTLTENIVSAQVQNQKESVSLLNKWDSTGLLEGLAGNARDSMSRLLENQAAELLRESSSMAGGDVEGFAAVAFPIVRRVFGGLLANDLVSVQPMKLPSGLIFFLDFTHGTDRGPYTKGGSIYGQDRVGSEIIKGVDISSPGANEQGFYNLTQGYTGARGGANATFTVTKVIDPATADEAARRSIGYDADLLNDTNKVAVVHLSGFSNATAGSYAGSNDWGLLWEESLTGVSLDNAQLAGALGADAVTTRRLTRLLRDKKGDVTGLEMVFSCPNDPTQGGAATANFDFPIRDNLSEVENGMGALVGSDPWELENKGADNAIPEIDIKVDSTSITATTRKLKAHWTPELGQDLNAYHNLDAEVELTGILSEQIALEIDQEILNDLVTGATAAKLFWSRRPGNFVNRETGEGLHTVDDPPEFTGTVSEWYETLLETINDVSADIHRKTLRGGANFLVCGPEVANILEFTSGFRAAVTHDDERGDAGVVKSGSISKKWDLYVDPYFPRNVVLVGRKGNSFLESGYVYAPYVPLQTTPTIFSPDDFTPRKGVMTRYGKKMVRPDMYGLLLIKDLEG